MTPGVYISTAITYQGMCMYRSNVRPFFLAVLLLTACSGNRSGTRASRPSGSGIVITADDIARSPGMSIEQILVAHVPGVTFGRDQDGRPIIKLRGSSTFMGNEEALVVVNGIALSPGTSSNLHAIDTHDIESITVLQDAASTAQWGSRGGNGVILIKTKRG